MIVAVMQVKNNCLLYSLKDAKEIIVCVFSRGLNVLQRDFDKWC